MTSLPSIRIEGGLLGPDVIEQLLTADLPGQKPADFGLDGRRNLTDEIAATFADCRKLWEVFQNRLQRLSPDDIATSVTRDAWAIPFLGLFGIEARFNQRSYDVDGMSFAISHRMGEPEDSPPVHIVGARQELGRVPTSGRPRLAPHSLVQEFLNRTEHVWGIVTNGFTLRLLRDSTFIRRQAYIEFDLQGIIEEQRFNDFATLYRLIHRTRLPRGVDDARDCLLEQYYNRSVEQGGRVREHLRDGVEECIQRLANGFLHHRANDELRRRVSPQSSDRILPENLYRQLLRLIYRFLFLLVSEDRGLLSTNRIYLEHYGVGRLRRLLDNRASFTDHDDVWRSLQVLWKVLSDDKLAAILELSPLNGELFAPQDLDNFSISNRDLLEAFWYLAWYQESPSSPPRRVNYFALDVEELGSVYESLLEFHPAVDMDGSGRPSFHLITGSERKTTGSYYTPPQLVNELIQSALDPVIKERLKEAERMAGGEWGMVPEALKERLSYEIVQRLSGSRGVAASDTNKQTSVRADESLSTERALRDDKPDSQVSSFTSRQYRGGMGEEIHSGIHSVPPEGEWQQGGAGDSSNPERRGETLHTERYSADVGGTRDTRQTTPQLGEKPPTERELGVAWSRLPLTIRHSLLAEHALLLIRVCDPACGSGHFLLAAARRIGKELARLRTGEDEPAPERVREATRDVISHCIYGVDKNPLAVDLCRVALWLESHTGGKPLTFLDHRIRCGDSLIGVFDLNVLKNGIPDKAFEPLEGDDKAAARAFAQRNRDERKGQDDLFAGKIEPSLTQFSSHSREIDAIADDSPDTIRRKKQLFEKIHDDPDWQRQKLACDLWTAAFYQPLKTDSVPITSGALADHLAGRPIDGRLIGLAILYAQQHAFFHWPLEFPEVFAEGGFDVVLSNPPWERIKLQEQEFFAVHDARIANAPTKAARANMIKELPKTNPSVYNEYVNAQRAAQAASMLMRHGGRYPLTGRGDINTYAVFAELTRRLIRTSGRCGIIVPTGIATDDTTKFFFQDMTRSGALVSLFDFENRKGIFPAIDSRMKFSLLTCREGGGSEPATFAFFALDTDDIKRPEKRFTLTSDEIELLNPNTGNCPIFRSQADAELTKAIYRRVPVLWREGKHGKAEANPWKLKFLQGLFNMSSDSHHFRTAKELKADGYRLEGNIFVKGLASEQRESTHPYWNDAAIVCALVNHLQRFKRPTSEFYLQKHTYIAKEVFEIPVSSTYQRKAAGPWSHDLRWKAIEAGIKKNWLQWNRNKLEPGRSFKRGIEHSQEFLREKYEQLERVVTDLQIFGDKGLERWSTILMVARDLKLGGHPVSVDAIQREIDSWGDKRSKEIFSEESVERTIHHMINHGWLKLEEDHRTASNTECFLPLYEAKMIHQFDHRWATYEERMVNGEWVVETRDVTEQEKSDPHFVVQPRYWVREEVVESIIPKYPEPLAAALRLKHRPSIQRVLSYWLAGYYLNRKLKPKADSVMDSAVRYSPNKEVAALLAGASTDELALQMERDFPLTDEDVRRIEKEFLSPESIATELVERFSPKWFLGWRDVTNTTNERTLIANAIPRTAVGHKFMLLFSKSSAEEKLALLANLNSVALDYVARQKMGGTSMSYFIIRQLPVLQPERYDASLLFIADSIPDARRWLFPRSLELVLTAHDMAALARDLDCEAKPFAWHHDRRFEIRCELDAAFFHLYLPCEPNGDWRMASREWAVVDETPKQLAALKQHFPTPRDAVSYILDQFPIVRRKDEEAYGRYRTKERILEIYDAMLEAIRTGKPYNSSLNPPPGFRATGEQQTGRVT